MLRHVSDMSVVINTIAQDVERTNKALSQVLSKLENLEVFRDSLSEKKVTTRLINVPYYGVKGFGRAGDLLALKYHLIDKLQGTEARCVALRGLPDRGKTYLAIEYDETSTNPTSQYSGLMLFISIMWTTA